MPITQYNSSVRQMSQSKFESMKNASGKVPDLANQIVMTNSEDSSISCLRTDVVYDMTSSDANINWGYPNGIQGNVPVTKDLTKYQYLDFVLTIYPTNSTNTGGWSGVYRLDLTTKKSSDNWCVAGYSSAYADSAGGIGNINAETWKFALYYDVVNKIVKWFIRFTNTSYNNNTSCFISKIYGVLKTPSMIYTGDALTAGNGISIANGVISAKSKIDLLWTNANLNKTFPSQTISLNLNDYDFVIIDFEFIKETPNLTTTIIGIKGGGLTQVQFGTYSNQFRRSFEVYNTGIYFEKGIGASDNENNDVAIPKYIYGVKI